MERHEFRMDTRGVDRHNVSRRVKDFPVFDGIWRFGRNDEHCVPDPGRSMERDRNGILLLEFGFCAHSRHQSGGADPDCVRAGRREGVFQDADRLCMADRGGNNSGFGGDSKAP